MKRRDFLKTSALASGALLLPDILRASANNMLAVEDKILIVIQWSGGNDGLNTVIPIKNDLYYQYRQKIGIRASDALGLTSEVGLHPKLLALREMFDEGELAILQNVGYPEPDRSHFRSMDIWQSASASDVYWSDGWIGRMLDAGFLPQDAIEIDDSLSLALKGKIKKGLAIRDIKQAHQLASIGNHMCDGAHDHDNVSYLRTTLREATSGIDYIYSQSNKKTSTAAYPITEFGRQMKSTSELIMSGCKTRVYYLTLGGFDTHAGQPGTQNRLFQEYSQAIGALKSDLKKENRWKDVAILTFSEFGRRVKENAGRGTDHGTAGVSFIMGGSIKTPGLYGGMPKLDQLVDGDLIHEIDFRRMYATLLDDWMGVSSAKILSDNFLRIPLFVSK